jgi:hypothetical protein
MNEMPLLKLLFGSPLFRGVLLTCIVAGLLGWIAMGIRSSGVAACERDQQILLSQALEEEHQKYMALAADAERISTELIETQRRLNDTKREYLIYAGAITGNCPGSVGVLHDAAARGAPLPSTSGKPDAAAAPLDASRLAANIAENYGRCNVNAAQLAGLIRWVEEVVK